MKSAWKFPFPQMDVYIAVKHACEYSRSSVGETSVFGAEISWTFGRTPKGDLSSLPPGGSCNLSSMVLIAVFKYHVDTLIAANGYVRLAILSRLCKICSRYARGNDSVPRPLRAFVIFKGFHFSPKFRLRSILIID